MSNLSNTSRKGRRSAFTLIEIMVATVIMVILVGLVVQITSEVLKVWNRSSGKLSANAEARIAMDLLTQDLETAVFRNNGLRWLEATQSSFETPLTGSGFQTTKLKLFSPALDRSEEAGDICGIAYLLDYRDPIDGGESDGDGTFILYRHLIEPQETFDELMGTGNQETFGKAAWQDTAIRGDQGNNYLVSNIVDFRIDFYVIGADGDPDPVSENGAAVLFGGTGATVGAGVVAPDPLDEDAPATYAQPLAYADITLTVISDTALQVIQNGKLDESGFGNWKDYVAANGEVFVRRVNFLAKPL